MAYVEGGCISRYIWCNICVLVLTVPLTSAFCFLTYCLCFTYSWLCQYFIQPRCKKLKSVS